MDELDIEELREYMRAHSGSNRSTLMKKAADKKAAYEELYNEHPWEFEPGEW